MKKQVTFGILALSLAVSAFADVSVTDSGTMRRAWIQQNQQKKEAKAQKRHSAHGLVASPEATGSQTLTDAQGLQYFFNTNITFSTSSSASAAASEASYTGPVSATTSGAGTTSSTLNDMYDGFQSICVSTTGATGPCATGDANYTIYNKNGPLAGTELGGQQLVFPAQMMGALRVTRKVYVPSTDTYARWMNIFTNTGGSPITFNVITCNNLGSDSNTRVVTSSSGDATVTAGDTWATSFQNYSGTTSSDPRVGHIWGTIQGVNFVDGDDNPYWYNTITVNPGETKIVLNYETGQPSKAAAAAKSALVAGAPPTFGMNSTEISQVVNFALAAEQIPALGGWALLSLALLLVAVGVFALRFTS